MIFGRKSWMGVVALVAVIGCDDGTDGNAGQEGEGDVQRMIRNEDMGVTPDVGDDADAGEADDASEIIPDAAPDGSIRSVEDCDDVCRVYDTCGRTEDRWGGDSEACLAACSDGSTSPRFGSYLACIQVTPCDRLEECVVPEKPLPTCEIVCEAIDGCDADFRLPTGSPDFATCADACEDGQVTRFVSECGQRIPDAAPDACDEPAFSRCILNSIGAECLALCEKRALCEDADEPIDCAVECLQNPPDPDADPVALRRDEQRRACLFNAATCEDVHACDARDTPRVDPATVEAICTANESCPFFAADLCAETVEDLLPNLEDDAADCLLAALTEETCGDDIYDCFAVESLGGDECEELCLIKDICGLLPEEQNEFLCLEACQGAVRGEIPGAATLRRQFPCAFRDSCEAVAGCVAEADSGTVCVDVCNAEIACIVPGDAECLDDCNGNFDSVRVRAETVCVSAADGCDATGRCLTPEPADCALLCDVAAACGADADTCRTACDDEAFLDRSAFQARVACVHSSARCSDVLACTEGDPERGGECIAWCRSDSDCMSEDPTAFDTCAADCGANSPGGFDGLRFDNAQMCLAELATDVACAEYETCLDSVEFLTYCARHCAEVDRCGLDEDEDPEACVATCEAAGLGEHLNEAACTLNAVRRRAGCAPVAACIGAEFDPADDGCMALCAAQQACDEEVDVFLCERLCTPSPEGTDLRAACAGEATCDELQLCLDADAAAPEACTRACATTAMCPGLIGEDDGALFPDVQACLAACGGAAVLQNEGFAEQVEMCTGAAMCVPETVAGCFEGAGTICQEAWDALGNCMAQDFVGGGNEAMFVADCQANIQMGGDPARDAAQCIIDAGMGDPASCLVDQIFCALF